MDMTIHWRGMSSMIYVGQNILHEAARTRKRSPTSRVWWQREIIWMQAISE
jgi:hypothetical protein